MEVLLMDDGGNEINLVIEKDELDMVIAHKLTISHDGENYKVTDIQYCDGFKRIRLFADKEE